MDAHVQAERADDENGDDGAGGALSPGGLMTLIARGLADGWRRAGTATTDSVVTCDVTWSG